MSTAAARWRIGVSTNADLIDGDLGRFEEELSLVAASGAEVAEIIFHSMDLVVNGRLEPRRLAAVKRITSSFAMGYSLHLPFVLNLLDADRLGIYTEVFRSGLVFAAEIGATTLVYHASAAPFDKASIERLWVPRYGTRDRDRLKAALFSEDAEVLARLGEEAARLGLSIGVENPNLYSLSNLATYGCEPEALLAQIERIGRPNVGLTLDLGHLFLSSSCFGFDYLGALRCLAPRALHTHIHDNFGKIDAGEPYIQRLPYGLGDLHLPPGEGLVPMDDALQILLESCYVGTFMLELEFRFWNDFPRYVEAFRDRLDKLGRLEGFGKSMVTSSP